MIKLNMLKKCPRCLEFKVYNSDNFFRQKSKPLGLMYHCKMCHMGTQTKSNKWKSYQKQYNKKYYQEKKEKERDRLKKYSVENRGLIRARERKYYKTNPDHKIRKLMSSLVRSSIKSNKNNNKAFDILGYTVDELKAHLESKFKEGMTWDNYGDWHIDHIRPISSFQNIEIGNHDFKLCWSLENLQPLWRYENQSKGSYWGGQKHFLSKKISLPPC